MAWLRVGTSGGPLEEVHHTLLRRALQRGSGAPQRREGERPDPALPAAAVALARANWRARMGHEHHSSAVFSNLLPQLVAAGAPLDFKTVALRCALDELHHAALCGEVVVYLGGAPEAEASLELAPLPAHDDGTRVEAVARNALFASLCETVSMALLTEEAAQTTDPFVARVLHQLCGDEVGHARFGWAVFDWAAPQLDAAARARMDRYLGVARSGLVEAMRGAMPLGQVPFDVLDHARHLGVTPSADGRSCLDDVVAEVLVPELRRRGFTGFG